VHAILLVLVAEVLEHVGVGLQLGVTLMVNGREYATGSSNVISTSRWPTSRRR